MRKCSVVLCALLMAVGLAPAVSADVIVSPVVVAGVYFLRALPWVLAGAAVVITVLIILRSKKKK